MHRTKLRALAVGIIVAAGGVAAGPLSTASAEQVVKPATTTKEITGSKVKTSDRNQQAVLNFIRG